MMSEIDENIQKVESVGSVLLIPKRLLLTKSYLSHILLFVWLPCFFSASSIEVCCSKFHLRVHYVFCHFVKTCFVITFEQLGW